MEQLFKETAIFINTLPLALVIGLVAGMMYYIVTRRDIKNALLWGAFFSYNILLLNRVWFCRINKTISSISLIPFSTLDNSAHILRFILNIIMFMPMGTFLFFLFPNVLRKNILRILLCGAVLSLAIEAGQGVFELGHVQTDDVIANTLGALTGWLLARQCQNSFFISSKQSKVAK